LVSTHLHKNLLHIKARIVYEVAVKAGAPENCIQWITEPSIVATNALMNHDGISTILATGGNAMVRAKRIHVVNQLLVLVQVTFQHISKNLQIFVKSSRYRYV
jgi:acyl-CoA reductase-like NAD-dependent aldehyde dehydrogenase